MPIPLGILAVAGAGAAGGGPAFELIESVILGSNTSSITFSNLGSYPEFKHLQVRMTIRSSTTDTTCRLRMNGDSSTAYRAHRLWGNPSNNSVDSDAQANTTNIIFPELNTSSSNAANVFAAGVFDILDFSNTSKNTTVRGLHGRADSNSKVVLMSGVYLNTSAVTSLTFLPETNFVTGSRFSLYGVR